MKRHSKLLLACFSLAISFAAFHTPALAQYCSCESFEGSGYSDFGAAMAPTNECKSCINTSGLTLSATRQFSNYIDNSGFYYTRVTLKADTTQTYQFVSNCFRYNPPSPTAEKCMAADPGVIATAGTVQGLYPNSSKYDEYGNRVESTFILNPGQSYVHEIPTAVLYALLCYYPDPTIVATYMPTTVWSQNFTTPNGPIPETNPMPSGTVNTVIPPEAKASDCTPGQCSMGDPVNTFNGNYEHREIDFSLNGLMPLTIERRYTSSENATIGTFGVGSYLATYNYTIEVPQDVNHIVTLVPDMEVTIDVGNGEELTFTNPDGTNHFINNGVPGTAGAHVTLDLDGTNHLLGATYARLDAQRHFFGANGRQSQIKDRNDNEIALTRDGSGKLTQIKDVARNFYFSITYNGNNLIEDITDHTGRYVQYNYNSNKELISLVNPASIYNSYNWDSNHRIKLKRDGNSNVIARNFYGVNGALTTQFDSFGEKGLAYDSTSQRTVTDDLGNQTTYSYNTQGYVTNVEDPLGHSNGIAYSGNFFSNNTASRYVEYTDANNEVTRVDLNAENLPTQITDALSNQTALTYDTVHKDRIKTLTDPMNHTTTYDYDSQGNLTKVTDPAGKETTFTYNTLGQILTITNALNKTTTFAYNIKHFLASITDALSQVTSFIYDNQGRVTKITDPNNEETNYAYDAIDRITSVTTPANNTTTFSYDGNNNLVNVTRPGNKTTTYNYDARNRLWYVSLPNSKAFEYIYDADDRLKELRNNTFGSARKFDYDAASRMTKATYPGGIVFDYGYDANNRLTSASDGSSNWTYAYDALGRVDSTGAPGGSVDYEYNADSLLTEMSSSGYGTVDYSYDSRDRLTSIAKGGNTYAFGYDDIGRRTSLTRPSGGVNTTYAYDDVNRLTGITQTNSLASVIESLAFQYDDNGNILQTTRSGGPFGNLVYQYGYNPDNQLSKTDAMGILPGSVFANPSDETDAKQDILDAIAATDPLARKNKLIAAATLGATLPENARWTFDAHGNIATKTTVNLSGGSDTTKIFTYDNADWLSSFTDGVSTTNLTYDNWGQLTSDGARTFNWNGVGELSSFNNGSNITTFSYDPLGRRKQLSQGLSNKTYLYDNLNILDDSNSTFLNGPGLDEPLQINSGGSVYSYLSDHLNSTTRLIHTSNGNTLSSYYYNGYGKLEDNQSNPTATNPFTYTGREDDGTGLYYYRNRYYDPSLEMFISQDPIFMGEAQRYVLGNPLVFSDPLGLYGLIIQGSTTAEVGLGPIYSIGGTAASGLGGFIDQHNGNKPSWTPIHSYGGIAGIGGVNRTIPSNVCLPKINQRTMGVIGSNAGFGLSFTLTNAANRNEALGIDEVFSLNVPFLGLQYSRSIIGNTHSFTVSPGARSIFSINHYLMKSVD